MRKIICFFLALLFVLGCTLSAASELPPEPAEQPAEAARTTQAETALAETAPPDEGIASVTLGVPEELIRTPENSNEPLSVEISGFDPAGMPAEGRACTLTLLRGEEILHTESLTLTEETMVSMPLSYEFVRYMDQTEDALTLRLSYQEQAVETEVAVALQNDPDEVYAAASGDPKPYAIDIYRNHNVVVVYGKDEAGEYTRVVHVFLCSTGGGTPRGTYSIGWKSPWRGLFGHVYGQYAMHITGNILFHSVPYRRMAKNTLKSEEFNKLGTKASMGCIRMAIIDVKWIYDNCPAGTSVHIFDAEELPVEKPEPIRIDLEDPRACWDPTDPDPGNPWYECSKSPNEGD